jgi:hypothetical protein
MELITKPVDTFLVWNIVFKEPCTEKVGSDLNIALRRDFAKIFDVRLNDIRINFDNLSNDFIHLSKFYGRAFFNLSFGLEEISATLQNPIDEKQVMTLYNSLLQFINSDLIARQKINIQQHLSTSGDVPAYMRSLNPNVPVKFEKLLGGRGVSYHLKLADDLTIYITVADSMFVAGGIFLSIENNFSPKVHDPTKTFTVTKESCNFILHELGLRIEMEV